MSDQAALFEGVRCVHGAHNSVSNWSSLGRPTDRSSVIGHKRSVKKQEKEGFGCATALSPWSVGRSVGPAAAAAAVRQTVRG